jgi:hypothetical protein
MWLVRRSHAAYRSPWATVGGAERDVGCLGRVVPGTAVMVEGCGDE